MRLVIRLQDHEKAESFSLFLRERQIRSQLDKMPTEALVWVFDEDDVSKAKDAFKDFEATPNWKPSLETLQEKKIEESMDAQHLEEEEALKELSQQEEGGNAEEMSLDDEETPPAPPRFGKLTLLVTLSCIILFIWSLMNPLPKIDPAKHTPPVSSTFTAPYNALVYEDPLAFQYAYDFAKDYAAAEDKAAFLKASAAFHKLYRYQTTPYWHGLYETYFVPDQTYSSLNKAFTQYPTFDQIAQGEIWRIVTPALLHGNLFHILFNLLWFVFLGNQIESRIGFWKFFIFVTLVAALSNTAQYFMSGPNFLGLSGVVLGMAGFIYVRQSKAAWEGYSIQRPTLYFLAFYVVALLALQLVSFGLELAGKPAIAPNIANTAHVVGALCGMGLGSLNFFSAWNLGKLKK